MTEIWTGSGVKIATGWTKKSCDGNNPPVKGVNRFGWKANGTTILTGKRKVGGAIKAFVLATLFGSGAAVRGGVLSHRHALRWIDTARDQGGLRIPLTIVSADQAVCRAY